MRQGPPAGQQEQTERTKDQHFALSTLIRQQFDRFRRIGQYKTLPRSKIERWLNGVKGLANIYVGPYQEMEFGPGNLMQMINPLSVCSNRSLTFPA